jgi:hypothetical protein
MATEKRLIDANALAEEFRESELEFDGEGAAYWVDCAQTVDAVEVVQCNNCKHSQMNGGDCSGILTIHHRDDVLELNIEHYVRLGFCSYGERKDNG